LVDVGGYRLHIHCEGQGRPTIVVEGGAGTWSLMWAHLLPRLAERSRTCVYDRAGYGWSEPSGEEHTAVNSAEDLRALLTNAQVLPPYVLVGHSYGCWQRSLPNRCKEWRCKRHQVYEGSITVWRL